MVAPVALVVEYVIFWIAVFIQTSVWLSVPAAELNVIVLFGFTVINPLDETVPDPQPPIRVTV